MNPNTGESASAGAGFAALAIGVAAALVPLRTELGSTNAALLLVLVVVCAASVGGRVAGAATAAAASMAFNFFYTKPYLTLRIHSGKDIITTVLIFAVGLAVGELGVARARQSAVRRSHLRSMRSLESIGALVSGGAAAGQVWSEVRGALVASLGVKGARFEATDAMSAGESMPVIERDGRVDQHDRQYIGDGFALPVGGAVLPVEADGATLGRIVLEPNPKIGVSREQRRTAVAFADQLAIALRREPQVRSLA